MANHVEAIAQPRAARRESVIPRSARAVMTFCRRKPLGRWAAPSSS